MPSIEYPTIAAAEGELLAQGYVRDTTRHVWVHRETGKTAKVVRTPDLQFIIQGG